MFVHKLLLSRIKLSNKLESIMVIINYEMTCLIIIIIII
jgi:hypothetical protein